MKDTIIKLLFNNNPNPVLLLGGGGLNIYKGGPPEGLWGLGHGE